MVKKQDDREGLYTGASSHGTPSADFARQTVGAYNPELSQQSFNRKLAWNETPQGRLAIRTFSRGIMGAAFFTVGGLLTRKWLHGEDGSRYDPAARLVDDLAGKESNPLRTIAKIIDRVVGKPIEVVVEKVATPFAGKDVAKDWAMRSVRFRPTKFKGAAPSYRGRSLGEEATSITFDFFMASVGDAFGRDIAGWFDPGVAKIWLKPNYDDKGNIVGSHVDYPEALKSAARSMWQYLSYNGGEDWAVALPYAYYMKAQRSIINHFSPGFMYDFDRGLNGSSFKVDDNGKIIGNYSVEGALDLQGRFTAYNIGTLMYREAYDWVADRWNGKPQAIYGTPEDVGRRGILGSIGQLAKWAARSVVKGTMYMTPAVPFFWATRTPQAKYRGMFINPKKGAMAYQGILGDATKREMVYANLSRDDLPEDRNIVFAQYTPNPDKAKSDQFVRTPVGKAGDVVPSHQAGFDHYGQTFGWFDATLNRAGKTNRAFAQSLGKHAKELDKTENFGWFERRVKHLLGIDKQIHKRTGKEIPAQSFKNITDRFVDASVSYTPYMYTKAEFSRLWDDGKMDLATERMIDGAAAFNWGEFKAGAGEVWNAFLHKPLADPAREAEARRRIKVDTSPTVDVSRVAGDDKQRWQDRFILSKPLQTKADEALKSSRPKAPIAASYADKEAYRKILEENDPPTKSVN